MGEKKGRKRREKRRKEEKSEEKKRRKERERSTQGQTEEEMEEQNQEGEELRKVRKNHRFGGSSFECNIFFWGKFMLTPKSHDTEGEREQQK